LIRGAAHVVEPRERLDVIKEDPPDNRILECAVKARADFIVSGNKHLLKLKEFRGAIIVRAPGFFERTTG
jgi:predicted nucleic acid-binding protein